MLFFGSGPGRVKKGIRESSWAKAALKAEDYIQNFGDINGFSDIQKNAFYDAEELASELVRENLHRHFKTGGLESEMLKSFGEELFDVPADASADIASRCAEWHVAREVIPSQGADACLSLGMRASRCPRSRVEHFSTISEVTGQSRCPTPPPSASVDAC